MILSGKRIAILAEEQYQDLEIWYPFLRFREDGATVRIVGTGTAKTYRGKYGYPVNVDLTAAEALADPRFDAVVIPGGWAPDFLRRHAEPIELIRRLHGDGRVVAAICHGGWCLVSAGVLRGRRATSFFAIRDDLAAAGAAWVDEEVVRDGNLITARKPEDLPAFCRAITAALLEGAGRESGPPGTP